MNTWETLADNASIEKTIKALEVNGIVGELVDTKEAAKAAVLEMIPEKAQVMTMTSVTLEETGIAKEINESGTYDSVRNQLNSMDRATQNREMQRLGAAPDWALGSMHAITEEGELMIASNTGSQLPAYVYGAGHVVFVVGAQKVVKNKEEGNKRIYEYVLPLESERAKKAYGAPGSNVSKLLVINKEVAPNRISVILVKEKLGF